MSEGINRAEGMLLLLSVVLEVFSFHFQYRRVQTSIYSFLSIRKKNASEIVACTSYGAIIWSSFS